MKIHIKAQRTNFGASVLSKYNRSKNLFRSLTQKPYPYQPDHLAIGTTLACAAKED